MVLPSPHHIIPDSFLRNFRYNSGRMLKLLLFIPAVALFMAINIVLGCYIAIRLGYGPPNWQTALNQVVRLTTLQNYLNAGRAWLEKKVPKVDQFLARLHVPKPIMIIDTSYVEDEEVEEEDEIMAVEGDSNEVSDEATEEDETTEEAMADGSQQPADDQEPEHSAVPE